MGMPLGIPPGGQIHRGKGFSPDASECFHKQRAWRRSDRAPTEIAGVKMENYIAWMKSAYYISTAGNPAISVPCAFSVSGLPIGIQIVGRHHDDWGVLQLAYAFEQATNIGKRHPTVV